MNSPIHEIRLATVQDAEAIHQLHTTSVRTLCACVYESDVIESWLKGRSPDGYGGIARGEMNVLECDGVIAGFSHVVPGEIVAIFVHPSYAGRGIGSKLLHHGVGLARSGENAPIKVEATLNAQAFYEKHGFVVTRHFLVQKYNMPVVEMMLTVATSTYPSQ